MKSVDIVARRGIIENVKYTQDDGEYETVIHCFDLVGLPRTVKTYTVIRRTVWQMADPNHILLYIREGSCTVESGGRQYSLQKGDLFFLPENTMYVRRPVEDGLCTMFYVHFCLPGMQVQEDEPVRQEVLCRKQALDDAFLRADLPAADRERLYLRTLMHLQDMQEEIGKIADACAEAERSRSVQYQTEMSVLLLRLMVLASGKVVGGLLDSHGFSPAEAAPANLRQAMAYIRQHEGDKITLTDLSAACAVSKQMMMRYFRANLRTTPTEYITRHKMNRAMELMMRMPELTVKEIAWKVGYEDQCYFSRVFHQVTGETPIGYRKRVCSFDERKHIAEAQKRENK